jgi:hypothetical protein
LGPGYIISVVTPLDVPQVKSLVCQVVAKEKPSAYKRLLISIYYDLDEYIPPNDAPILDAKLAQHSLAMYIWNIELPQQRMRLTIGRDAQGKPLEKWRGYDFDHAKECS